MKKKKVALEFFTSNVDFQEDILDSSEYKKQLKTSILKNVPQPQKSKFQQVFPLIQQMREKIKAPVDTEGPENLYNKSAPINEQRFQILVSLMLSVQTKDEITGFCMRRLLKEQNFTIERVSQMDESSLKELIREVNFNATKAKRIIGMAQQVQAQGGKMPETYKEVMEFNGVGEKIALLYMLVAFQKCLGIAVDVNMLRVCQRIGLSRQTSPNKMRRELELIIEEDQWAKVNHAIVGFGQTICLPNKRERCNECLLNKQDLCDYVKKQK